MSTVRLGRQKEAVNEDITCLQRGNVDRHSARGTDKVCKKGAASTGSEGCRGTCLPISYKEYCTGYDVILLGPQIAYRREKIAAECGNLPVLAIAPGDYAAGNAAHILEQVETTLRGLDE